ncbi:DNA mismatch repair protein MutS [Pedobacter yulinensis]|uniref:DNA mismatch repair protein MutS n=1 Tax=Pedobacter yulinensis TaxID=2126353 RepID=A0A2T3HGU5_9SPHI|nr:DNA mismatch repair protein MutS [Pedobacter yulinensis]PST81623.1 DNA mismatch repair protein MutS [Pedobacter yulinensis]
MLKDKGNAGYDYEAIVSELETNVTALRSRINRLSFLRLVCFGLLIAVFVPVFRYVTLEWAFACSLVPVALFVQVIRRQQRLLAEEDFKNRLIWIYNNEIRISAGLENGYGHGGTFADEQHPYLSDLDIFGPGSLYGLLNRCSSREAAAGLAASLSGSRPAAEIRRRQQAIAELEPHIGDSFVFRARLHAIDPDLTETLRKTLSANLRSQLSFLSSRLLNGYTAAVPYMMGALFAFAVFLQGAAWSLFGLAALANAAVVLLNLRSINVLYAGFGRSAQQLQAFSAALHWIEQRTWTSELLRQEPGAGADSSAAFSMKKLARIMQAFDARLNMLVGGFLNMMLLWDVRCAFRLKNWLATDAAAITTAFERMARLEELLCFATLSANHPDWALPAIQSEFCLRAQALAHPLIVPGQRVANDYEFETGPVADLITGSNMAGKSTFLRTVGVNMVLAFAGGHVCAGSMSVSVFSLFTYMRIRDSLNDRTSTFKAELNRLKMILEGARESARPLVLIDEMLRGTNSRDKYLGSKVFLEKLIADRVPVLFATHDLQLASLETEHKGRVRNFHFDISITDGDMRFDYQLKAGPCNIFNAALLLREIGLNVDHTEVAEQSGH